VEKQDEPKNHLLRALPGNERQALQRKLETVDLDRGETLHEPGSPVTSLLFPESCVISVIQPFSNGEDIEAATIGCEGILCIATALAGHDNASTRHKVQIAGRAHRLGREAFSQHFEALPEFRRLVLAYAGGLISTLMLSVACNRSHEAEKRLARWLLMTHDRSQTELLPLTQDVMAEMLGVHRPTVSLAIKGLERAGLIETRRGVVRIRDRPALEAAACECYAIGAKRLPARCD
jgi:CRP-like cAMP-binding protein